MAETNKKKQTELQAKPQEKEAAKSVQSFHKKPHGHDGEDDDSFDGDCSVEEYSDEEEESSKFSDSKKRKSNDNTKKELTSKKRKLEAANGDDVPVTVFVGNLSKHTMENEIAKFFNDNNISVADVRKPTNKNTAFVDLENIDELEEALTLHGATLHGRVLTIEKANPRNASNDKKNPSQSENKLRKEDEEKNSRTLFVKRLPDDVTVDSLLSIFDTAIDVRIPQHDGVHKGFGFIEFEDSETMELAMSENQGVELNGNTLYLDYMGERSANRKQRSDGRMGRGSSDGNRRQSNSGKRGVSKILFVKNLSFDSDEYSLMAAFKGAISARVPTFLDSGKPKGFAFVDFATPEAAARAFDRMKGRPIDGRQVTLDFAQSEKSGRSGGGGGGGGGGGRGDYGGYGGRAGGRNYGRDREQGGGYGFQGYWGLFNRAAR